ncbi:MAG: hypothetical protein ACLUNZ_01705 [Evtepia sp.]
MNVPTVFENGYAVTDDTVLETAEMALSARVNKSIVSALDRIGAKACGVSGRTEASSPPGRRTRHWVWWGPSRRWTPAPADPAGQRLPARCLAREPQRGRRRPELQRRRRGSAPWPRLWARISSSS